MNFDNHIIDNQDMCYLLSLKNGFRNFGRRRINIAKSCMHVTSIIMSNDTDIKPVVIYPDLLLWFLMWKTIESQSIQS